MSPVASNGPPHARGSSVNGGVPLNAVNGMKPNEVDGLKGANRVFLHLDDLSAATPNVDMNWPIRRLLQEGELLAKQADTHLDFRRPDVALQEYLKAYTIAVVLVPAHKDYPSLHTDRGELHRLYKGLTKRINAQHEKFAEVKQLIKENNARNGVKPTLQTGPAQTGANGVLNGHARIQSTQNPLPNGSAIASNGIPPKKKPPVQPKPDALHGNAITSTSGNNIPHADLATRFAMLRTPEPKQDPRIRTQPISIPGLTGSTTSPTQSNYTTINRPAGPRDLPSVPRTMPRSNALPPGIDIPSMPKPPAAVYDSPIRGPETISANLLSSRSSSYRNSGREDAAPPISTVGPTPILVDNRPDYFAFAQPAHTSGDEAYYRKQNNTPAPVLSDSPTVTAEELVDLLAKSSQSFRILLVDLRSREEFDTGHIMSQFIICVEPITLKVGISGEQLADSMVIAPDLEQNLYDQRHEFDLIVIYDQSSESLEVSKSGVNETEKTINDFVSAVFDYGYEKRTKRRPKLLSGGIDAWVDLLGPNSLKHSVDGPTLDAGSRNGLKPARPLSRTSVARARNLPIKRRRTYSSRPLTKEEEIKWDSALREESVQSPATPADSPAEDLIYARTTEDFFRRYPELPAIQESMVKPVSTSSLPQTYQNEFASVVPRPPARPPPALPRQRSSGISERGPIATYAHSNGDSITQTRVVPGLTGLHNPNNLCYFNSAIQILSATPFLRELLLNHQHPPPVRIPRKDGESSDPLQLMVRSLGNLLGHMWSGQYDYVTPNTLRKYVNSLHAGRQTDSRVRDRAFGGPARQHDSMEFFHFLIDILMDEMNPRRNIAEWALASQVEIDKFNAEPSILWASNQFRKNWMYNKASELADKTDLIEMSLIRCNKCGAERRNWQDTPLKFVLVEEKPKIQRLADALTKDLGAKTAEELEFGCESCGKLNPDGSAVLPPPGQKTATGYRYQVWLPDYLWINLNRYTNKMDKLETVFTFPEYGLDLTPTFPPDNPPSAHPLPRQQTGPFLYDVYAVIQHGGKSIAHGHYWTLQKNFDKPRTANGSPGAGAWHKYNDETVTPASFADTQTSNTSGIFLVRQGAYKRAL